MNKAFWTIVAVIGFFVSLQAGSVQAHEGRLVLRNNSLACEGLSVWKESHYRITGRCSGLVYPYAERLSNYVLWVKSGQENPKRIGSVNLGYFDASSTNAFDQVILSAEGESYTNKPSDFVLATGNVQPFDFPTSTNNAGPTPAPVLRLPTPTPTPVATEQATTKLSTGLKRGAAAIAIILGVVIAIAVAMLIVRRNN